MRDDAAAARRALEETIARANAQGLQRAAAVRAGGRVRYVLDAGVLRFGLLLLVVFAAGVALLAPARRPPLLSASMPAFLGWFVLLTPVCIVLGAAWGLWMWRFYEQRWFPRLDEGRGSSGVAT